MAGTLRGSKRLTKFEALEIVNERRAREGKPPILDFK